MKQVTFEEMLARLYTEHDFRKRFFMNREGVCRELGLDCELALKLSGLQEEEVEFFARGLINKRFGVVKSILPLVSFILSKELKDLFTRYAQNTPVSGMQYKHYNDAVAFCGYLLRHLGKPDAQYPWLRDLIRYEQLQAQSVNVSRRIWLRMFDYPVHRINKNMTGRSVKKSKTFMLCFRNGREGRLHRFFF